MHGVASIGSKLYVQGGACYDRKSFVNFHDCSGGTPGLGKRLYVFDVRDEQGEWKRLPVNAVSVKVSQGHSAGPCVSLSTCCVVRADRITPGLPAPTRR